MASQVSLGQSQSNLTQAGFNQTIQQQAQNVDQLSDLQEFTWQVANGPIISFPVTNVQTNISQDLVVHKFPDLDAGRVENTGRNPTEITVHAVFVNTITPSKKESWKAGTLYPSVFGQVLNSAMMRQTGVLQTPNLPKFSAKLAYARSVLDADYRGGETLELHWIETIGSDLLNNIASSQPSALAAAQNLDSALQQVDISSLKRYGFDPNLMAAILEGFAIATTISAIFSNATSAALSGNFGLPTQLIIVSESLYNTNALITALTSFNDPTTAEANNAAWIYLSAIQQLNVKLNQPASAVLIYITTVPLTIPGLCNLLNQDLSTFISLNPNLLALPTIPAHSSVRYIL